jgi:hypothetical protein
MTAENVEIPDHLHGRSRGYRLGCRCEACTHNHSARSAEYRRTADRESANVYRRRKEAERYYDESIGKMVHPNPPKGHGSVGAYTGCGCRCDACREAMRDYVHSRRQAYRDGAARKREEHLAKKRASIEDMDLGNLFAYDPYRKR